MKGIAYLIIVVFAAAVGIVGVGAWSGPDSNNIADGYGRTSGPVLRKIDLNSAPVGELEKLPGIGAELAERVIRHRPYRRLDELVVRKVLGRKQFARIKEHVRIQPISPKRTVQ